MALGSFVVVLTISALIVVVPMLRDSALPTTGSPPATPIPDPQPIKARPGPVNKAVAVQVFNNSTTAGLDAVATNDFKLDGWNSQDAGAFTQHNVITSTAYYRPDTEEEAVAAALAAKFDLRTDVRFPGIEDFAPGVIVILTNDYNGK